MLLQYLSKMYMLVLCPKSTCACFFCRMQMWCHGISGTAEMSPRSLRLWAHILHKNEQARLVQTGFNLCPKDLTRLVSRTCVQQEAQCSCNTPNISFLKEFLSLCIHLAPNITITALSHGGIPRDPLTFWTNNSSVIFIFRGGKA